MTAARRPAHRRARPAHPPGAGGAVRARDRDRRGLDGRRARHLGVLEGRPAGRSSTGSARTCCGSRPASRSWATRPCCPSRRRRCCGASRGVEAVAADGGRSRGQTVRRNPYIDEAETGGISVAAADPALRATVGATLRRGAFLNAATGRYPAVVLGAEAAATLGIDDTGSRVWIGERWFTVDRHPRPGHARPEARHRGADRLRRPPRRCSAPTPTRRRSSSAPTRSASSAVRDLLGRTANPERPEEVDVSRPVRRARGARGGQDRVHLAVPRPRRGRAARRRRRDRQRDGHLGARAPLGDRPAPRARARPGATSACSSWPSRCCSRASAAWPGTLLGALVTVGYATLEGWTVARAAGRPGRRRAGRGRRRRRRGPLPGAARRPPLPDGGAPGLTRHQGSTARTHWLTAIGTRGRSRGDAAARAAGADGAADGRVDRAPDRAAAARAGALRRAVHAAHGVVGRAAGAVSGPGGDQARLRRAAGRAAGRRGGAASWSRSRAATRS